MIFNKIKINRKNSYVRDNEDIPILDFIDEIYGNEGGKFSLQEVGSGECRFVKKIANLYDVNITCIEINPDLAQIAKDAGFETINENILNVEPSKEYDITHCSHVIEHFGYPQVIQLLNYLVDSTKVKGYLIIRSPLMYDYFYHDIDHIRPYPPESILAYFRGQQQQKRGKAELDVKVLWYRTGPRTFKKLNSWNFCYHIFPIRLFINMLLDIVNRINFHLWAYFRYPSSKPDGYVMILHVLNK